MAVEVVYRSSRDPERLFMDKAEADRHDRMLELAEALASTLQQAVPGLAEEQAEEGRKRQADTGHGCDLRSWVNRDHPQVKPRKTETKSASGRDGWRTVAPPTSRDQSVTCDVGTWPTPC